MPSADNILSWAASVANAWRWLAIAWHVGLAVVLMTVFRRPRVSQRSAAFLCVLPVTSVAAVAWISGNPFNGAMFTLLAIVLLRAAARLPKRIVLTFASRPWVVAGAGLIGFGWLYPHFLITNTPTAYAYASPFGLLPCPTLSVLIGVMLVVGGLPSAGWNVALTMAGVLYGAIGVFRLGVVLDGWLLAGAILLGAQLTAIRILGDVRATEDERTRRLPGDELIPKATGTLTHAITLFGPADAVWPWLVQMGAGSRAGWYSYDFIDNGRQPSASRIVTELQQITVGALFPALPGVKEGFIVLALETERLLILAWPGADGSPMVTWAFVLEPQAGGTTRLIVRVRGGQGYRFRRLPLWLSIPTIRLVHFVMERKQLLGLSCRVLAGAMAQTSAAAITRGDVHRAPRTPSP